MTPLALLLVLSGAVDVDGRLADAARLAARQETSAAIDAYRGLLAEGVESAALRYNLGTLLLESGDLGGAIQQLLAARRTAPLDDDIEHNLSVAMEARADRLAGVGTVSPVWFIGERTPPGAARWAPTLCLVLLGAALAGLSVRRHNALVLVAAWATLGAVLSGAVLLCRLDFEGTREAVVLVAQTSAHKEPDAAAAESFVAHAGLSGVVVDDQGSWVRLRMDNGLDAWFERAALGFVTDLPAGPSGAPAPVTATSAPPSTSPSRP